MTAEREPHGPKYSIIVPAWNGVKYLPTCVNTIVSQEYENYELIISDDHSTDGSKEYLATLSEHANIRVIEPPESMSMTEHWEWALSHARGRWLIFVGQDDGLQPYFFRHADKLTTIAEERRLRTIMSRRAFFFWEGCQGLYGDLAVNFHATKKISVHNSKYEALKALLGIQVYFELPEMYTTSLFQRSILTEARARQGGHVLTCHPQDANLGVIACSLDKYYLKSSIPLGWVGTSPKSAGMAIAASESLVQRSKEVDELALEYKTKVKTSKITYSELAGDFALGDASVYFWQAFLKTPTLRGKLLNVFLVSTLFKTVFLGALKSRLQKENRTPEKMEEFGRIVRLNKCSSFIVDLIALLIRMIRAAMIIPNFSLRAFRKVHRSIFGRDIIVRAFWTSGAALSMEGASVAVLQEIERKQFV
jgi:glycosyltransferase involved in cell wall biosynthesis